jgi:hypothetical protein
MKKLFVSTIMLASFCAVGAMAEDMTGFISESGCGAKHTGADAKADAACVRTCIKNKGTAPVFVSDGKVYKFDEASLAKAKKLAGDKVQVSGTVNGDTVSATSIKKAS